MRPKSSCFCSGKVAAQAGIVGHRLLGDGAHDRHQLGAQLGEQRAHAGDRHALVGTVDQRVGDVRVGTEVVGKPAAEIQRLLEIGPHGGEVVGRPRARPGVVGGRAHLAPARDEIGRHLGRLLVVAAHDADEAGIVGARRAGSPHRRQPIEQPAERRIGELLVREPAERRALAGTRGGPALGHVGRLIPAEHGAGIAEVGNLEQPPPQLRQLGFGGKTVAGLCGFRRASPLPEAAGLAAVLARVVLLARVWAMRVRLTSSSAAASGARSRAHRRTRLRISARRGWPAHAGWWCRCCGSRA